jgi:hypothetical protein
MSIDPVAALIAYHAALDDHDIDQVERLMAENARYESAGIGVVEGRVAILTAMRNYFATHLNHHAWDEQVEATGPRSARSHWRLTATKTATGQTLKRAGIEDVMFDSQGLVLNVFVVDTE